MNGGLLFWIAIGVVAVLGIVGLGAILAYPRDNSF